MAKDNFGADLRRLTDAAKARGHEPVFVLLRDKKAFQKDWPNLKVSASEALQHIAKDPEKNAVGIQPASIGCVVFDCDEGEGPEAAFEALKYERGDVVACVTPSSSGKPNKGHVWVRCDDPASVRNWKFSIEDPLEGEASGELRSTGQVRLNPVSVALIADHLLSDEIGQEMAVSDFASYRTSSVAEIDVGFDRQAGREPTADELSALADRLDGPDEGPRFEHLYALAGDLKCAGISFDAVLDLLSQRAPGWLAEDGDDDGKFAGGELERHLVLAWSKLSAYVEPSDDFDDDLFDDEEPKGREDDLSPSGIMRKWVFVADAMKFIRKDDLKQFKPEQWNSLYASLQPEKNLVQSVYKGKTPVKRYEALAYVPGKGEVIGKKAYNIWRPSSIEPVEGDVSVIERHMELMFPDPVERRHVMDFMHFVCVKPETKLQFALLIQGAQGTGKTALGMLMKRIIGAVNVVEPSQDELRERWSKWQEGASLALVEELMMEGRLALANKLKPVITNETLRIEDKGAPLYSIPNHLNLMCFTNHKNAVRLEEGDRRWLVLFSPMEPEDDAYYDRLFRFIEGPGPARWLHRLREHKPELNPNGRAPDTAAKAEMREASLTDIETTVHEWMASGTGPMYDDLFRFEEAWAELRVARANKAALTSALKSAGCVKHPRFTNPGLPNVSLWSCRNHDRWADAGPKVRAKAWMDMHGLDDMQQFKALMA